MTKGFFEKISRGNTSKPVMHFNFNDATPRMLYKAVFDHLSSKLGHVSLAEEFASQAEQYTHLDTLTFFAFNFVRIKPIGFNDPNPELPEAEIIHLPIDSARRHKDTIYIHKDTPFSSFLMTNFLVPFRRGENTVISFSRVPSVLVEQIEPVSKELLDKATNFYIEATLLR